MKKRELARKIFAAGVMAVMAVSLCGEENIKAASENKNREYQITGENANPTLLMNRRPESSYWFPEELLIWNPEEDADLKFNVSSVPLAKRVEKEDLIAVNDTQNTDTKLMAISIMNTHTSGNAPHGSNSADCNIFTYWQYVDELVYWGGSSGEGLIVPPSPDVTDLGHKNGVPVIGTVFFPQGAAGGKLEWLNTFLEQEEDGSFPLADKLAEAAEIYGFDGWFINQETEGTKAEPLTKEHAEKMRDFIQYFKHIAPEQRLIYYDSMTVDGQMNWQNALTDNNAAYLLDEDGEQGADEMFLNFWWTNDRLAGKKLLEQSAVLAQELGIDPYDLYAGIDIQANGSATMVRWDLFESFGNSTHTSLGLYCPSWAYMSSSSLEEFHQKENTLWVNNKNDPSADITYYFDKQWRGISTYIIERSALTELPFITNFNTGSGYSFFKNGEKISELDWNNRSIGDILPTYRWMISGPEENQLTAAFDTEDAWYGGTSLKLSGSVAGDTASVIQLYSADLPVDEDSCFSTTVKANAETELNAILTFDDGSEARISGSQKAGNEWTAIEYDISAFAGKRIRRIAYELKPGNSSDAYEFWFGNISMISAEQAAAEISGLTVEDVEFDEDGMYAGVRLSWESSLDQSVYEIYRVNEDESVSFLGLSNTDCFYIDTLPRTGKSGVSEFEIVPVSATWQEGEAVSVSMEWPQNNLPRAGLKASQTLVSPGTTVTFSGDCSSNTESISWLLPGSDLEQAEGTSVSVAYENEGVFDVTVIAQNSAGEDTKIVEDCIYVSSQAEELLLLSQNKDAEATSYVNENEAPPFAVDGNMQKKWCAVGNPPHELVIDLGEEALIGQIGIAHAQAGGENADMNTKAYTLSVSTDGSIYVPVISVTKNTEAQTMDTFAPVSARFVKLSVEKPTQGADTAARIYEIEVYGCPVQ